MKVAGSSRRSNVATSPCRDVLTSRRWVNQYNSQQAVTSRRRNVATSQCRDVATSRRLNVATSQRRDVSARFALIIKSSKGSEFEGEEEYERGHGIQEQQRHRLRRSTRDLYCFPFFDIRMMFLRLNIYIFLFSMF